MGRPTRINNTVRGRITSNTVISGNTYTGPITTNAAGLDSYYIPMWCNRDGVFLTSSTVRGVGMFYSEYKFQPSTMLYWEPACPLTSTGNYWLAWTDNPELISQFANTGTSTAARVSIVKSVSNARCYPIWQSATIRIGASKRSWYSTDISTLSQGITDQERQITSIDTERLMQGAFLFAVEGALSSQVVARAYVQEHIHVRGLLGTIPDNSG